MAKYVLELRFDKDNEKRLAVRPRHREYLRALLDEGKLFMAGPWGDDSGAVIIYEVADEAAARALLDADPYSEADVYSIVALREWRPILPA
jgi:uncharacterized protein YciI